MSIRSFLQKAPDPLHLSGGGGGLDPADLFGIPPPPAAPPPVPQAPAFSAAMGISYKPTQTNFGSFNTPIMRDTLNALHPAIPYKPPQTTSAPPAPKPPTSSGPGSPGGGGGETGTGGGGGGSNPPPGGSNPVNPSPPGTIGIPTVPQFVVSRPSASPTAAFSRQYAQTPNTVVSRSSMTVPGTAVVSNAPAPAVGIKPGLLASTSSLPGGGAVAGGRR